MNDSRFSKSAALTYSGEGAPAEEFGIPVVEEAGLVQMLCQIPLGEEIPPALYVAVAEVLAHVFRINNRIDELT
jgi:flagellar biosynthesis protein